MLQCQRDLSKYIIIVILEKFSLKLTGKLTPGFFVFEERLRT